MALQNLPARFEASMVLAGVGDAIGYKNGALLGGLEKIQVTPQKWMVSDDTVMHIATAKALLSDWGTHEDLYHALAKEYRECMKDMSGRAPGITCSSTIRTLRPGVPNGYVIPFNPRGGGCGAAMRSAPIGLLYWKPEQIRDLVAVSIEAGRMSHNHPTGFLGSLATTLFISFNNHNNHWSCD